MERFRRDLIAKDGVIAESAMRQVIRLNSHNVAAHLRLAELYHLVGMRAECAKHLRHVLAASPGAAGVQEFLAGPGAADEGAVSAESFEECASNVQGNGAFAGSPAAFPSTRSGGAPQAAPAAVSIDADALREAMAAFGERDGVRNAVLLDKDGAIVADYTRAGGIARAAFAELVAAVRDAADDASRRMDTGALVRADVEGPGTNIVLTRVRGITMALLYAEPIRPDAAWEIVQEFTAHHLPAGREPSRA
jgi:predicted regulator of Ras-like GTPase activity (Roadblock/LC7/MglB family)